MRCARVLEYSRARTLQAIKKIVEYDTSSMVSRVGGHLDVPTKHHSSQHAKTVSTDHACWIPSQRCPKKMQTLGATHLCRRFHCSLSSKKKAVLSRRGGEGGAASILGRTNLLWVDVRRERHRHARGQPVGHVQLASCHLRTDPAGSDQRGIAASRFRGATSRATTVTTTTQEVSGQPARIQMRAHTQRRLDKVSAGNSAPGEVARRCHRHTPRTRGHAHLL